MIVNRLRRGDVVEVLGGIAELSTYHNGDLWYEITFMDGSKLHRKADSDLPITQRGWYSQHSDLDPVSGVRFGIQVLPDDALYIDVDTYRIAAEHRHPSGLPRIYVSVDNKPLADFTKEEPAPYFVMPGIQDTGMPYYEIRDWRDDGVEIDTFYDDSGTGEVKIKAYQTCEQLNAAYRQSAEATNR